MKTRHILALALAGALGGCGENAPGTTELDGGFTPDSGNTPDSGTTPDGGETDGSVDPTCSSGVVDAVLSNVEICTDGTPVRHVRIENIVAPGTHTSAQFFLGLDAPASAQQMLGDGEFKLMLYNLGTTKLVYAYFGDESVEIGGDTSFVATPSTICMDLFAGSESSRAAVVLWRDGVDGADCEDPTTLTIDNAFGHATAPTNGALALGGKAYFYRGAAGASPVVTLSGTNAVDYADVPKPTCTSDGFTIPTDVLSYHELCRVDGTVRHVRMGGLRLGANHATATLLFGQQAIDDASVVPPAATGAQTRVQFYGGMAPQLSPQITPSFGSVSGSTGADTSFLSTETSDVCFDLHDGSATTPPYFVLWKDGSNGADCDDTSTLTLANATAVDLSYGRNVGAADKSGPAFLYLNRFNPEVSSVTLSNAPVLELSAEAVEAAVACATTWTANQQWQEICRPTVGDARHFRIEAADATEGSTSRYFYLLLQRAAAPEMLESAPTAPIANDGMLNFVFGRSHANQSATWVQFNGASVSQHALTSDGSPLYTAQPNTICLDLGRTSTELHVLLWATSTENGGPNCDSPSTLTVANAIYDSETQDTALDWAGALASGRRNFIKRSGVGVEISRIVSRRYPAAL